MNLIDKALEKEFLNIIIKDMCEDKLIDLEIIQNVSKAEKQIQMIEINKNEIVNIFDKYKIDEDKIKISDDEISGFINNYSKTVETGEGVNILSLKNYKELNTEQIDEMGFPLIENIDELKERIISILKRKKYLELRNTNIIKIIDELKELEVINQLLTKDSTIIENETTDIILSKFEIKYNKELTKEINTLNNTNYFSDLGIHQIAMLSGLNQQCFFELFKTQLIENKKLTVAVGIVIKKFLKDIGFDFFVYEDLLRYEKIHIESLILDSRFNVWRNKFINKFGWEPYIPEPGGTKEQVINAIKKCLYEDKDILKEILSEGINDNWLL